jgi:hypothetical protein
MTLATLIIKESAVETMVREYPDLFQDSRIHILTWPDAQFNTQLAIEQIRKERDGKAKA